MISIKQIPSERGKYILDNNNIIMGCNLCSCQGTQIIFRGSGNILFLDDNCKLENSKIEFAGNNSVVFLGKNKHKYKLNVSINHDSVFFMGRDNYMNGAIHAILSEQKNIFIGDSGLYSFGIWMRTADPHLIYDEKTKERINLSRSIYIGDHVWIGQNALILKNACIHSGTIIAAQSVVSGKKIDSNTIWGGNPAKRLRSGIFWDDPCVHKWKEKETKSSLKFSGDPLVFHNDASTVLFGSIEKALNMKKLANQKFDYLLRFYNFSGGVNRNRFAMDSIDSIISDDKKLDNLLKDVIMPEVDYPEFKYNVEGTAQSKNPIKMFIHRVKKQITNII